MNWLKKVWRYLAIGAGIVLAILIKRAIAARLSKVDQPLGWYKIPGNDSQIVVDRDGELMKVDLPEGIKADDVEAAGLSAASGDIVIGAKHDNLTDIFKGDL